MRTWVRRTIGYVTIYAVALHAVLLGVAPVIGGNSIASDPFSIICRSDPQAVAPTTQSPVSPDQLPGHACEHCILCSTSVAPPAPDVFIGTVLPLRIAHVLRPALSTPRISLASDPKLARGPPQAV